MCVKMLVIQFSYSFAKWLKKDRNLFLRLFDSNKTVWWWKNRGFFCFEKMLIIQFPYMEIAWLAFFWWQHFFDFFLKLPQLFCFLTANRTLWSNKHSQKNCCLQNLTFWVHNVVLDTLMLDFFWLFAWTFFSKVLKTYFFVWNLYVCLDQCLIIWKIKNLK